MNEKNWTKTKKLDKRCNGTFFVCMEGYILCNFSDGYDSE